MAVSTIVSEQKSAARASWAGVLWGLGHTASLLVAGLALVFLKLQIPAWLGTWLELAVAAMLVLLGVNVLRKAFPLEVACHAHQDESGGHAPMEVHPGAADEPRPHQRTRRAGAVDEPHPHLRPVGLRPFLVGIVHGMAGSASLMLLVLATISSPWVALGYVGIFGVGSIGGMLSLSWLISLPFVLSAARFERFNLRVRIATGLFSCLFGLYLAWHIVAAGAAGLVG